MGDLCQISSWEAQWPSGRVLDSRSGGPRVPASPASLRWVLEQDKFILA